MGPRRHHTTEESDCRAGPNLLQDVLDVVLQRLDVGPEHRLDAIADLHDARGAQFPTADGTYTYTPGPGAQTLTTNQQVADTFTYTAIDNVIAGTDLTTTLTDHVTDRDNSTLPLEIVAPPTLGTVTVIPTAALSFRYQAPDQLDSPTTTTTFTYRAYDGTTYSNTATITINLIPTSGTTANDVIVTALETMFTWNPAEDASPQDAYERATPYLTAELLDTGKDDRIEYGTSPEWIEWQERGAIVTAEAVLVAAEHPADEPGRVSRSAVVIQTVSFPDGEEIESITMNIERVVASTTPDGWRIEEIYFLPIDT